MYIYIYGYSLKIECPRTQQIHLAFKFRVRSSKRVLIINLRIYIYICVCSHCFPTKSCITIILQTKYSRWAPAKRWYLHMCSKRRVCVWGVCIEPPCSGWAKPGLLLVSPHILLVKAGWTHVSDGDLKYFMLQSAQLQPSCSPHLHGLHMGQTTMIFHRCS